MARRRDQIIAMVIAIAFFGVSFALSFAVIWELYTNNKETKKMNGSSSSAKADDSQAAGKLAGTKLADFTPVAKVDSLQKIDTQVGTGEEIKPGDTITVDYTGALAADGTIFQSSLDSGQPVPLSLNGVIAGWQEGIPGMKVGGKRRLLIPAAQAYGASPREGSGIPANADLVFDITVHKIGE